MKEELGYPVCSGWFEEFCIMGNDCLHGQHLVGIEEVSIVQPEDFEFEPMCNHHQGGVYLSRKYWVAMVEMFGFSIEEGVVLTDPDAVEPEPVTCYLNTRDPSHGTFSDCDIMDAIAEAKGISIGPDE